MSGGSGADFMIHGIVKYHLFGHELWLTTTTVGMTIVTIVLLILVEHSRISSNSVWKCWKI